jgi:hypothetical protein
MRLVKSDKAVMDLHASSNNGLTAVARKAAFPLRSSLLDKSPARVVVLIILVLLTQSGVGLIA